MPRFGGCHHAQQRASNRPKDLLIAGKISRSDYLSRRIVTLSSKANSWRVAE